MAGDRLAGRGALVTGGASGIGEAIARSFCAEGARVLIVDLDAEQGKRLRAELPGAAFLELDVSEPAGSRRMVEAACAAFGRLDIVVNNAFWARANRIQKLSDEAWSRTIRVTQDAVFFGIRAAFEVMIPQGSGAIVNTASISGLGGDDGMSAYNAAKAAVINLTRAAALEAARHGVRVNCVCPGLIETPAVQRAYLTDPGARERIGSRVPLRRLGRPEDVANVVLFLASDEAAYVTGAAYVVDGGQSIRSGVPDLRS